MATAKQGREKAERKAPSEPRPSASLILVNERNEVLMIQRNMEGSFAGAYVSTLLSYLL